MRATKTTKIVAYAVLWTIILSGMGVPVVIGVLSAFTPDNVVRTGSAGAFVSAATSEGGFLSSATTTVQSSMGSIAVRSPLSALRGQRLEVVDRLRSRLHLCVQANPPACVKIDGLWAGPMHPAPRERHPTDWLARHIGIDWSIVWFAGGFIAMIVAFFPLAHLGGWDDEDSPSETPRAESHAVNDPAGPAVT